MVTLQPLRTDMRVDKDTISVNSIGRRQVSAYDTSHRTYLALDCLVPPDQRKELAALLMMDSRDIEVIVRERQPAVAAVKPALVKQTKDTPETVEEVAW